MSTSHISETLKKTFPHWTAKEVSDFVKFLNSSFRDISQNDEHIVLTTLNDSIIKVMQRYDIPSTQPGRLRTIYRRNMLKIYDKQNKSPYFERIVDYLGDQFDDLDQIESIEKIDNFFRVIRSSGILTDTLEILCDHIEIVAKAMLDELNDSTEKWSRKDFWKEVEKSLLSKGIVITDTNFNQLKKRLKDRIYNKLPDAEGLLHFAQKNTEEEKALQILYTALSSAIGSTNYLASYRYSVEELNKMIWLKELFEKNGFSFAPNSFPEVYYDDYDKVNPDHNQMNPEHINPDELGIYTYKTSSYLACADSYEGHIVLFKDRIDAYCVANGADIDSVKFVVLMHELGHWLSHWSKKDNYNWKIGYFLPNTHTKEALAQLIAYWACQNSPIHYQTLLKLTPKAQADPNKLFILKISKDAQLDDGSVININDPYGGYWLLKDKPIEEILIKLHQLREGWMLKDEKMMEFLVSSGEDIVWWMNSTKKIVVAEFCFYDEKDLINNSCIYNFSSRIRKLWYPNKGLDLIIGLEDSKWYNK